jgi:hypothetical protein
MINRIVLLVAGTIAGCVAAAAPGLAANPPALVFMTMILFQANFYTDKPAC